MAFTEDTFSFLSRLAENNNRDWFHTHKHEYEALVREPVFSFIEEIKPHLEKLSPHFMAKTNKMGGSLVRVYRDVRFSKNKTPYKTHIGIRFRHEQAKDGHAPGFYVHIEPSRVFIGMGKWNPHAEGLKMIRQHIDTFPQSWMDAQSDARFLKHFALSGESLKRAPKGYPQDHPMIDELKRKEFIAIAGIAPELVLEEDFSDIAMGYFELGSPYVKELCRAVRVSF